MPRSTKPVPEGMHTITPQLVIRDAQRALDFYKTAFGAEVAHAMPGPDGKSLMHAALKLGDSSLFLTGETAFAKQTVANLFLYVNDVDAAYARAVKAGCKSVAPLADMFWGDRWGSVEDPFGNQWQLATHIEDVEPAEMQKRMLAAAPPA